MNATQVAPRNLRHAALLVHAMGDEDRDWILAALPESDRQRLAALLVELREIGVTRDATLLHRVAAPASTQAQPCAQESFEPLDHRALAALARVLNAEPAQLVACFLDLREWSWRSRLLRLLEPSRRSPARRTQVAPALQHALVAAVGEQIEAERASGAGRQHAFRRAAQRLSSLWSAR